MKFIGQLEENTGFMKLSVHYNLPGLNLKNSVKAKTDCSKFVIDRVSDFTFWSPNEVICNMLVFRIKREVSNIT